VIVISYNTRWWNKNHAKVQPGPKPKPPPSVGDIALSILIRIGILLQFIFYFFFGSLIGIILCFICLFVLYHWLRIDSSENSDFNLDKLEILETYFGSGWDAFCLVLSVIMLGNSFGLALLMCSGGWVLIGTSGMNDYGGNTSVYFDDLKIR
jgi:hypothetical protein